MKSKDKNIHANHRERMRNKAKKFGFEHFENHELLEFVLFNCLPRVNTNPIAHNLINKCENLLGVLTADEKELLSVDGMGEKGMLFIKSLKELYQRALLETKKSFRLNSKVALKEYALSMFKFCVTEKLYAICLDKNMFHLSTVELGSEGKISEVSINTTEAVLKVLDKRPTYVVLVHNHTDDNLKISYDDGHLTIELYKKFKEFNIEICDHIIVSGNNVTTFDEQGVMDPIKQKFKTGKSVNNSETAVKKVSSSFVEFDPDFEKFK